MTGRGDAIASFVYAGRCDVAVTPIHDRGCDGSIHLGGCNELATPVHGGRYVHARVAVEEVGRLQFEAHVLHGHHGEVLDTCRVRDAEAVPDDRVVAGDWAVLRRRQKGVRLESHETVFGTSIKI